MLFLLCGLTEAQAKRLKSCFNDAYMDKHTFPTHNISVHNLDTIRKCILEINNKNTNYKSINL